MECKNNGFSSWVMPEVCQLQNQFYFLQMESDVIDHLPDQYSGLCNLEIKFNSHAMKLGEYESPEDRNVAVLHSDHCGNVYATSVFERSCICYKTPKLQRNSADTSRYLGKTNQNEGCKPNQTSVLLSVKDGVGNGDKMKATHYTNVVVVCRPTCQNPYINSILGCEEIGDGNISGCGGDDDGDHGFGSDCSCSDVDSDSENELWNSFNSCADPYNLYNFTAQMYSGPTVVSQDTEVDLLQDEGEDLICPEAFSDSGSFSSDDESDDEFEEDCYAENLELWKYFENCNDPYNPFNFRAQFQPVGSKKDADVHLKEKSTTKLPNISSYVTPSHDSDERFDSGFSEATNVLLEVFRNAPTTKNKKVTFSDDITEYYINSQEDRKGPWEEFARDRCRFQKRVKEVEYSISYCFTPEHRWRALQRLLSDMSV
ncbi:protein phosphatase 1 regulatory subunit 15B [Protopterus annectens]|uniref:protein phosphatase 1 regulatory subunit 15B n=1 Tax=Protopterus annectens TaxID=7888 RepID=UPI001CFBFBD8|nr:protein phosphatase 1 regulatory subunit 15B [Protopterus annectens]